VSGLATLLRLQRQRLDEVRTVLSRLEQERAQILARERRLEDEFRAERRTAAVPELAHVFLAYSAVVAKRREELNRQKAELAVKMDGVRTKLQEAFREYKKIDIGHRRRLDRLAAEAARRERGTLDEIGLTQYRRRKGGDPFTP